MGAGSRCATRARVSQAIAPELAERADGLVDLARRLPAADLPPPRLLGAFDPVLLGWTSREPLLGAHEPAITIGGMFLPFALVRGKARRHLGNARRRGRAPAVRAAVARGRRRARSGRGLTSRVF